MKNKIFIALTFVAGLFLLNACLKDDADYWKDDVKGSIFATIASPVFHSMGLQPNTDTIGFSFLVNIATEEVPASDITLTFGADSSAVSLYNKQKSKNYKLFPNIKVLNPTLVIKAGTRTGTVNVEVWGADALSACDNFMAAISILSTTGGVPIAANMKSYLMALPIANPYQGLYHSTGFFKHPTASSSRALDQDKTYSTIDCKSVHGDLADLGPDYTIDLIVNEDSVIQVGGKDMLYVKVIGYGAQVTEQIDLGDDLITLATGVTFNYYDPSKKEFVLRYHYNNGAAWREIMETLTKK
jgi:hypothetical protein